MTDSLRDRIAAALGVALKTQADENNGCYESWDSTTLADVEIDDLDLTKLADAVIAELKITVDGGVIVGCIHD